MDRASLALQALGESPSVSIPCSGGYRQFSDALASGPISPLSASIFTSLSPVLESSLVLSQLFLGFSLIETFFFFLLFNCAPTAYRSSQARGRIRATVASLHHSHSNMGSKPCQQPTPQLTATPDLGPTERDQGSNLHLHGYWLDSFPLSHNGKCL